MCGLAGFIDLRHTAPLRQLDSIVRAMADRLRHRGPDDAGTWVDEATGVALGHRRLSIVDLSPSGRQPMISASGRYVIIFNGEIYNFLDLRQELEGKGYRFGGHSDTEVMLAAFDAWGVLPTLKRLIGMFAFALWDRQDRTLILARDHLGIKPLYYAHGDGVFLFGSELKAIRAHPLWRPSIDRDAVAGYMRFGYVPGPLSIWREARKLMPGTMLTMRPGAEPETAAFWRLADNEPAAAVATDEEAVSALDELLRDAVRRQMVADVPLGAFLSGGIDSSTVVALMQAQSGRAVKTFSIGFNERGYDEAPQARAVAQHLGTDHSELYVTSAQALDVVPHLTEWYDEPFSDSSQIPTYLVSKLARGDVTVALSGDGGDETFGGYDRYFYGVKLWRGTRRVPGPMRPLIRGAVTSVPASAWDIAGHLIPARWRPVRFGERVHKAARLLDLNGPEAIYRRLVSQWQDPDDVVVDGREPKGMLWDKMVRPTMPDFFSRMQFLDTLTYLPDDILTKVDRASMAVSLECRVPLLDHRVVEFGRRLPHKLKERSGKGKWLLRQVLARYVPTALVERPKMGFGVPIDHWLRGPLRDWAEALLSRESLVRHGLLRPEPICAAWDAHMSGEQNLQYPLWAALMLQSWLDRQQEETTAAACVRA
jgi:asparagine synthase (glutamine-hydrolysing)